MNQSDIAALALIDKSPYAPGPDRGATSTNWLDYFTRNRAQRMSIPWEMGIAIEPCLRKPLARSLQRFQAGERGDGAHLKRVASEHGEATGISNYFAAIQLFVEEEQEHAELMAGVLKGLGAPVLDGHWSNTAFRFLCLLSGLHAELMVLLVTETIAKQYFRLLHESFDDPVLRAVCAQIGHDEDGHIDFHSDALRPRLSSLPAVVACPVYWAWQLFFDVVCLVVVYDHRTLLRATNTSPRLFWRDCKQFFGKIATRTLSPITSRESCAL